MPAGILGVATDTGAPVDTVVLDEERQAIVDGVLELGDVQGRPLDPACVSTLIAVFPARHLEFLAREVDLRLEQESESEPVPALNRPSPLDSIADFAYEVVYCIRGDADPELVSAAIEASVEEFGRDGVDLQCVESLLATWPDSFFHATAEGRTLTAEEWTTLSTEDFEQALETWLMVQNCGPDGRERMEYILGTPVDPIASNPLGVLADPPATSPVTTDG